MPDGAVDDVEVLDLCAGPGGWSEGIRMLDPALHARELGIEWDDAACQTREAAGHRTLKADIATVDPSQWRGIRGLIASPPCTLYSQAGSGIGRAVLDQLADAIWRIMHGDDCREEVRAAIYPTTRAALVEANAKRRAAGKPVWTDEQVERRAREDAYVAALVLEPARYIGALDESLEWCAFEQVPAVLPLWQLYVTALRKHGWSAWCGTLNAADYGVPQTRTRAILIARRTGAAHPPEATHAEGGGEADLFGGTLQPWVSMAEALGWTAGVGFPRRDDRGDSEDGYRERDWRSTDEPAFALTEKARSWTRQPDDELADDGNNIPADVTPADVEFVIGSRAKATVRRGDQPAPTLAFGHDAAAMTWMVAAGVTGERTPRSVDDPAPTQTGKGTAYWIGDPAAQRNGELSMRKSRNDGLRVTHVEAAVLQSFPPDYPWQGNRTAIFRQVGDAMPPRLAAHVIAAALGHTYR